MKLDRLLAITMTLLNQTRVSAVDLAGKFEVSLRTIYRDMEAINQAGIPIVSFPGSDGGYEIMEGYRLDKQLLTLEDFVAISTALRGIQTATDNPDIAGLLDKLSALKPSGPNQADHRSLELDFAPARNEKDKLGPLHAAVRACRHVSFHYLDAGGNETTRTIEPMGLYLKSYNWYLYGYCLSREDLRTFRLSRMSGVGVLPGTFVRRPYTLDDVALHRANADMRPQPFEVKIRFKPIVKTRVRDEFDPGRIETLEDGSLLVTAHYYAPDQAVHHLLAYSSYATVLEPSEIVAEMRRHVRELANVYGIL